MKEISAGIIIYRKTREGIKFLLLYHGGGYWNFPKGKIENVLLKNIDNKEQFGKETSFQAAIREVKEETGISRSDLKFMGPFKVYEKFSFWRGRGEKKTQVFKIVIFYLAETIQSRIKLSYEHSGYAWFTFKEGNKILNNYKDSQRVLTEAYNFLHRQSLLANRHSVKNISKIKTPSL